MTAPAAAIGRGVQQPPIRRRVFAGAATAVAAPPDLTIKVMGLAAVLGIWRLQEVLPGAAPLKLPMISLIVGVLLFFANRPVSALSNVLKHRAIQSVVGILLLAILSGPFALVRGYSLIFVLLDLTPSLLLCVFAAAAIRSESDARWLLAAITVGGVIFCLYSRFNSHTDRAGRPTGIIFYDANDLALLASTTAALALGLGHTALTQRARMIWLGSAGVLLVSVLWTVSRGAFLALSATSIYLLLSPVMPAAKRTLALVLGFVGLLAVGGQSYIGQMKTMLAPEEDYNFSGASPNGRGEIWKRGMQYVKERPLLGAGARNYTAAENRSEYAKQQLQSGKGFKLSRAHNSYLEIAVELGIPGFLLFTFSLLESLRRLHVRSRFGGGPMDNTKRMAAYMAAGFSGLIVGAFFLSAEYFALVYAVIGIAAALTTLKPGGSARPLMQKAVGVRGFRGRRAAAGLPAAAGMASR